MNDLLLFIGLAGVALEGGIAARVVYWMVYRRPRFMMRWAVRERARMTRIETVLFLANRRGKRRMEQLHRTLAYELSPALAHLLEVVEGLAYSMGLSDEQPEAKETS